MKNRKLHIIYTTIIVSLFIWMFIHRLLVVNYSINPWKLGGMAMYTNVHEMNLDVLFYKDGQKISLAREDLSEELDKSIAKFYDRKHVLGDFASHKKLGMLLVEETIADRIAFKVETIYIDPKSKNMTSKKEIIVWPPKEFN